ncbi:hypothetical protein HYW18_03105 [Candidatus Uhrbacteria bacterium]|nr:hypothetical protein [Candidatus Uhrbacteria bacterium]
MQRRNFLHRLGRKKWASSPYKNPYFDASAPLGSRFSFQRMLTVGLWLVLFVALFLGLFWTPILRVDEVRVSGVRYIDEATVQARVEEALSGAYVWIIPRNHRFFLPLERIRESLGEAFLLNTVDLRSTGRALDVVISEKLSRALWRVGPASYIMDEHGVIVGEQGLEPLPLVSIVDVREEAVSVGQRVLSEEESINLLELVSVLGERGVAISEILYDKDQPYFVQIVVPPGYKVIVDPATPLAEQLDRYTTVLRTDSRDPSVYEYIDVRFGNRVYVKDR